MLIVVQNSNIIYCVINKILLKLKKFIMVKGENYAYANDV